MYLVRLMQIRKIRDQLAELKKTANKKGSRQADELAKILSNFDKSELDRLSVLEKVDLTVLDDEKLMFEARLCTFGCGKAQKRGASKTKKGQESCWPHEKSPSICARKMAVAGFWYKPETREDDSAQCPHCLLTLDCWDPSDDPMVEHSKRQDQCEFFISGKNSTALKLAKTTGKSAKPQKKTKKTGKATSRPAKEKIVSKRTVEYGDDYEDEYTFVSEAEEVEQDKVPVKAQSKSGRKRQKPKAEPLTTSKKLKNEKLADQKIIKSNADANMTFEEKSQRIRGAALRKRFKVENDQADPDKSILSQMTMMESSHFENLNSSETDISLEKKNDRNEQRAAENADADISNLLETGDIDADISILKGEIHSADQANDVTEDSNSENSLLKAQLEQDKEANAELEDRSNAKSSAPAEEPMISPKSLKEKGTSVMIMSPVQANSKTKTQNKTTMGTIEEENSIDDLPAADVTVFQDLPEDLSPTFRMEPEDLKLSVRDFLKKMFQQYVAKAKEKQDEEIKEFQYEYERQMERLKSHIETIE